MSPIRALEFFSGIGGLHFGFLASGVEGQVLASFDMNAQANASYEKSFGTNPVSRGIDKLTLRDLEKYNANCWLMSPPCQPYTRGGKLLDDNDSRAKPLLHLVDLLEKAETASLPTYIFLENVKNFEISRSRDRMVRVLHQRGYVIRECLVAPYHFGVPNDRLRYFVMARLRSSFPGAVSTLAAEDIGTSTTTSATSPPSALASASSTTTPFAFDPDREPIYTSWPFPAFVENPSLPIEPYPFEMPALQEFLDNDTDQPGAAAAVEALLLPKQLILERPNFRFDIVRPSSTRSSCFTKAYGSHHIKSGGGLLQTQHLEDVQEPYDFADSEAIAALGLRFFSPTEVARLHAFPLREDKGGSKKEKKGQGDNKHGEQGLQKTPEQQQEFISVEGTRTTVRRFTLDATQNGQHTLGFPETMKTIQKFRLLGNSLNVWVVAELLRAVLFVDHGDDDVAVTLPLAATPQWSCTTEAECPVGLQRTGEDLSMLRSSNKHPNHSEEGDQQDSIAREAKRRREDQSD